MHQHFPTGEPIPIVLHCAGFPNLTLGQASVAPLAVTVSNLVSSLGQDWQLLTAAAFLSMRLPLIVFFALQRYFVRGILAGSVKG